MNVFFIILTIVILILVIRFQYKNYVSSNKASREIDDLINKPSERSDWKTELERLDRVVAPRLDDIRRFSNAALVTGIGGTMAIFFIEVLYVLLLGTEVSELGIKAIVQGALPALISSLSGIFVHLLILSLHLPEAQKLIVNKELKLLDEVAPKSFDGPTVNVDIGDTVEKIFQEIADTQKGVAESTQKMIEILKENKAISMIQRNSASEVQNGVQALIEQLKSLPKDLHNSLQVTEIQSLLKEQQSDVLAILSDMKGVAAQISGSQEKFSKAGGELLEAIKQDLISHQASAQKIDDNIQLLTQKLETIPDDIRSSLEKSEFFDKAARDYLKQLHEVFVLHESELKKEIIQNQNEMKTWLSGQIGQILTKVMQDLQEEINDTIVAPLDIVSKKLNAATKVMPDAANKFGTDLIKSAETLTKIPDELTKISERVTEIVHMTLKPISDEMKNTNQGLEKAAHGLIDLIKKLILRIELDVNEEET